MPAITTTLTCTALDLHDNYPCSDPATSLNGLFCPLHSKLAQGLYRGYKKRSAELEDLDAKPPKTLPKNYGNSDFDMIKDADGLHELHSYLLRRYNLLNRCVTARDFHMSHFYKDTSDYGHQAYLDRLRGARITVAGSLNRLERRMMEVKGAHAEWYEWVKSVQAEEDQKKDAEKKRVKAEAALFKKHQVQVAKLRASAQEKWRRAEDAKEEWYDPIEEIVEDHRIGYVSMINHLIGDGAVDEQAMADAVKNAQKLGLADNAYSISGERADNLVPRRKRQTKVGETVYSHEQREDEFEAALAEFEKKQKKRAKKDKSKQLALKLQPAIERIGLGVKLHGDDDDIKEFERKISRASENPAHDYDPNLTPILRKYQKLKSHGPDLHEVLREHISGVQEYRLLRCILAFPSLLSVALEAETVERFLADSRVRNVDLRDLALQFAKPSMNTIRDACANYWAANERDSKYSTNAVVRQPRRSKSGSRLRGKKQQPKMLEYVPEASTRIKLCGKWLSSWTLNRRLSLVGWALFAALTQASVWTISEQTKSWEEFLEFRLMSLMGYFSTVSAHDWTGPNETTTQQNWDRMGLVAWERFSRADQLTNYEQTGTRGSRQHIATEARTYIFCNASRYDARIRRFIKMMQTFTTEVLIWVRDKSTGEIIASPPDDELWLVRDKDGLGRVTRGRWKARACIDAKFMDEQDKLRTWRYNFSDYLDIVLIDRRPGRPYHCVETITTKLLHKALKVESELHLLESHLEIYQEKIKELHGSECPHYALCQELREHIMFYLDGDGGQKLMRDYKIGYYNSIDKLVDKMLSNPYNDAEHSTVEITTAEENGEDMHDLIKNKMHVDDVLDVNNSDSESESDTAGELVDRKVYKKWPVWEQASEASRQLYEEADETVKVIDDMDNERRPGQKEMYAKRLRIERQLNTEGKNKREKARLNRQYTEAFDHSKQKIPKNWRINQFIIEALWNDQGDPSQMRFLAEQGIDVKLLRNKKRRADNPQPRRRGIALDKIWDDWEETMNAQEGMPTIMNIALQQTDVWQAAVHKGVLRLWANGLIQPSYFVGKPTDPVAPCFAGKETDDGESHLYIYYKGISSIHLHDPTFIRLPSAGNRYLRNELELHETSHPGSVYSLLRIRSEPECWPMPDFEETDQKHSLVFLDPQSRAWEWSKMPKDVPHSEVQMHSAVNLLLQDPPDFMGGLIKGQSTYDVAKFYVDQVLVMHKDPEQAQDWTARVMAYLRKIPYRFDLDLGRSFLNVDAEFLWGLEEVWWIV